MTTVKNGNVKTGHTGSQEGVVTGRFRNLVFGLAGLFCLVFIVLAQWLSIQTERESLVRMADSYSDAILSFRAFYSEVIVSRLAGHEGVEITHDYLDNPHAIPIPATMTLDLVDYMNRYMDEDAGHSWTSLDVAQVSMYPFSWREDRKLTPFQLDALQVLSQSEGSEYHQVLRKNGQSQMSYAKAIRMEASCVACHNYHPDSPKTDWKVGDLRAIQVVSLPTRGFAEGLNPAVLTVSSFVLFSFLIAFIALYWMDGRVRRALQLVEARSQQREQAIKALDDRQYALDQHAIVSIADSAGRITYANEKFCQISGFSLEELLGQNHRMVKSDQHPPEFYRQMWQTISSGQVWQGEVCNRRKGGGFYWVAATIVPFMNERGKPEQYISIRTDITRRKEIESMMAEQGRFLAVMTDALGEGVYALDDDGYCTFVNPEGERILGWSAEELKGKQIHDIIHHMYADGSHMPQAQCPIMLATSAGEAFKSDREVFIHRDGIPIPVSASSVPMIEDGVITGSVTVFSDIRETKHREQALLEASQKADKANRAKSEFLSSMSHELRTPLNAILGFGQLLEYDSTLPEDQAENVQEILKAGNHLLTLINEVLDLAKIESGRIDLSLEPVELQPLIEESLALITPLAQRRSIECMYIGSTSTVVRADHTRLKQVLLNLLSNGIKYNHEHGKLYIAVETQLDWVVIRVTDTGPGIAEDRLQELFEPFNRLDAENSEVEGTGIGLTITRRIVELMGGRIDVESKLGHGSSFSINLPRETLPVHHSAESPEAETLSVRSGDGGEHLHTVLYIEDNPANIRLVAQILTSQRHIRLITAHLPELGIELAVAHRPDLILLDINMPGMNGYEVLERFSTLPEIADTPVIAISANAMEGDIRRGLASGFKAYLTKPIVVPEFLSTVQHYLHTRQPPPEHDL